jgi:hypothetical protein
VTDELWYLCERTRASRRRAAAAVKTTKSRVYLLQGILFCANCDSRLWCQSTKRSLRYQDNARHRKAGCSSARSSVACEVVDKQVERVLPRSLHTR